MDAFGRAERAVVEPVLRALDAVRKWLLKQGAPVVRPFVRSRDYRVAVQGATACTSAVVCSVVAPGYLLLLGPLLLGVPHLFSEARYLFFQRPEACRRAVVAVLCAQTAAVLLGFAIHTVGIACAAGVLLVGGARHRTGRVLLLLCATAQLAALVGPTWSRFLLLHGHNCIALLVWLLWRRRRGLVSIAVPVVVIAGAVAILAGCFDGLPLRTPLRDDVFSLTRITDAVAGGFGGPWRARLLLFFCYTQSVHYAIWIRLIPEEARERETPRSWAASWTAYVSDVGPSVARLTILATVAVPILALALGAVRVRSFYVTVSEFHATVELVLLAALAAGRRGSSVIADPTAENLAHRGGMGTS